MVTLSGSHYCYYRDRGGVLSSQTMTAVCTTNTQHCTQVELECKEDLARLKPATKQASLPVVMITFTLDLNIGKFDLTILEMIGHILFWSIYRV